MLNVANLLRVISAFLIVLLGIGIIAFALAADSLGFGSMPGLGPKQVVLIWFGAGFFAGGIYLFSGAGRGFVQELFGPQEQDAASLSVWLVAVWFGLLTGLVEVAIHGIRKITSGEFLGLSLHVAWMSPVATLVLFLIVGIILFAVSRLWTNFNLARFSTMVFAFLSLFSILLMFPQLHKLAALLLSIGLAVQIARVAAKHPSRFYWFLRRTLPGIACVVLALATVMIVLNP